jgi:hypothetical protein
MSSKAESVWTGFRELSPQEQQEVFQQMMRWRTEATSPQPASDPIRSARGLFAGSGLNESLLASRAEDRHRG